MLELKLLQDFQGNTNNILVAKKISILFWLQRKNKLSEPEQMLD